MHVFTEVFAQLMYRAFHYNIHLYVTTCHFYDAVTILRIVSSFSSVTLEVTKTPRKFHMKTETIITDRAQNLQGQGQIQKLILQTRNLLWYNMKCMLYISTLVLENDHQLSFYLFYFVI